MPVTKQHPSPEDDPKVSSSSSLPSPPSPPPPPATSSDSSTSSSTTTTTTTTTNSNSNDLNNTNTTFNTIIPDNFISNPSNNIPTSKDHLFSSSLSPPRILDKFNSNDYLEGSASPISDIISIENNINNTTTNNYSESLPSISVASSSSSSFTSSKSSAITLQPTSTPYSSNHKLDYFTNFQTNHHHYGNNIHNNDTNKIPRLLNDYLRPNAQYIGEQQSGKSRFHIKVEFKTVDLINSIVTGFLQISGLTENHSEIITCFKGEIINNPLNKYSWHNTNAHTNTKKSDSDHNNHNEQIIRKYSFITENKQWGSYIKNDFEHWKKLSNMSDLSDEELQQRLIRIQNGEEDNEFIYMRWKEEFLLPDSRVKQISGASFDGFYYIVLNIGQTSSIGENNPNMIPGSISGLYYHKSSEKFQSLSLRYVDDRGISGSFEFV